VIERLELSDHDDAEEDYAGSVIMPLDLLAPFYYRLR